MSDQTFRIPVSNGLFEHCAAMGEAIWYFLWCIDKTTKEKQDDDGTGNLIGAVLGGMPVRDSDAGLALGREVKTIRRWRKQLTEQGYLETKRTPVGYRIWVKKSKKKWVKGLDKNVRSDGTKMSSHPNSDLPPGEIRKDISGGRVPETGTPYRQNKDSIETKQKTKSVCVSSDAPLGQDDVESLMDLILTTARETNDKAMFSSPHLRKIEKIVRNLRPDPDRLAAFVRKEVSNLDPKNLNFAGDYIANAMAAEFKVQAKLEKQKQIAEQCAARGHAEFVEQEKALKREQEENNRAAKDWAKMMGLPAEAAVTA